jgi:exo-beta-1,3-glucanase (GH17 family)
VLKKRFTKYTILALLLALNISWWGYVDRPHEVKAGSEKLDCVSYNPYRKEYTLDENKKHVSPETIDADFAIISKRFRCIRTYTSLYGMDVVPEIAEKYGLTVIMGTWVSADLMENMHDLETALAAIKKSKSVTHLLVGNEALFFDIISSKYLYLYLSHAQKNTKIPISTGEIISTWDEYKKL